VRGGNDGVILRIVSVSKQQHQVVCPANTLKGTLSTLTFASDGHTSGPGEFSALLAYNGSWWPIEGTAALSSSGNEDRCV